LHLAFPPKKLFIEDIAKVLLELLLASRHLCLMNNEDDRSAGSNQQHAPLTSIVLDTLLCILVDSPSALRTFEHAQGVQLVVRILKRAGTPREVRYVKQLLRFTQKKRTQLFLIIG